MSDHTSRYLLDVEKLRHDLVQDSWGAYYGAGIGPEAMSALRLERASAQELVEEANRRKLDLKPYLSKEEPAGH